MKKKILLLSHSGSVTGGAEQCLLEYVDVLIRKGYVCRVVVPRKGDMTKVLAEKGIDYVVIGYGWATKPHRKVRPQKILASTGNSIARIFQEVEKFKPNIIITNTSVIPWGLYAGKTFGIPNIMLVHEILSDKDPSLNMVPSDNEYMDIINKNTDYIVYNSRFVKEEFAANVSLPKTSKSILYPLPPLDSEKINHLYKENTIDTTLKIAIFGALSPRKNQLEALQAAKILKEKGIKNFTIDLYGDKTANIPYTKSLRKFISENSLGSQVKIKGFATNVYERMNEYNVVLSAATYEPFGRTIIEGQLFGRIAIANNTGGGTELVNDKVTGMVYELGNPAQLADKIIWVLQNKQSAIKLGNNAKTVQHNTYITNSRYGALIDAVEYFDGHKAPERPKNIIEPVMALFQYNHQLNNKYKYVYRLFHNRLTYMAKHIIRVVLDSIKRIAKQLLPIG